MRPFISEIAPRPAAHSRPWILTLTAASGLVLTAAAAFTTLPFPPCPFKLLFHLPCPGCGLTRSLAALWHGDLLVSFRYHPLGAPLFAGALASCLMAIAPGAAQRQLQALLPKQRILSLSLLAVLLTIWAARLTAIAAGSGFFLW